MMFKIDTGRFGLALRIDSGPRLGTGIVILGLSSNRPPEILLDYPEDDIWHVESVFYFVHENRSSPTAIVVRQQKRSETADVIARQTLLYRFDHETGRYVAAQIPQPRLDNILSAAERSRKTLKIVQTGDIAVENTKGYRDERGR